MIKKIITFLLILFFILKTESVFAQDSLRRKSEQIIGLELQVTPNSSVNDAHHINWVEYMIPGYNLFYRFILPTKNSWGTLLNGSILYRNGKGYDSDGGLGGSSSVYGKFNFLRLQIGIARQRHYGKNKNFIFGAGLNYGRLIFGQAELSNNNNSQFGSVTTSGNINDIINSNYFSLNLEISQAFKLIQQHYLIIGIKQYIETADFTQANRNLTSSLFLAYKIH
jgi:hypothetical protein